jgi:type 1 fimbria pilin
MNQLLNRLLLFLTGATTFTAGRLLIGNSTSAITEDPELTWNGTTNILTVSGTGAITTVSATNIGIGITNPTTSSIEIVRPVTTATDILNMRYDATNGLRYQQAYVAANDIKYNIIQKEMAA